MSTDFRGFKAQGTPLVSVIAVCYNQSSYVLDTLNSILNQTYTNIQLIIIDDCSQDGSVNKIENWIERNSVNCKFIPHQKNIGICKTLNEALDYAVGKYIQLIACDDILLPTKLQEHTKILEKAEEDVALVYSDAYLIDEKNNEIPGRFIQRHRKFNHIPQGWVFEDLLTRNYIPAMSVLMKRKVYEVVGNYDENLDFEDYDMWLRVARKFKFLFSEDISVKYRLHTENLHKQINYKENNNKIYMKHIDSLNPIIKRKAREGLINAYKKNDKELKFLAKKYFEHYNDLKFLKKAVELNISFKYYHYPSIILRKLGFANI